MRPLDLLRHLTALYVEDDPEQRDAMGDLLRGFFRALAIAEDGAQGLRIFRGQAVQFVIADLRMPGMNGLELASAIRQEDRQVPILLLSAFTETADLLAATRLHLVDYLVKPLTWERLKASLERCAHDLYLEGKLFVRLAPDTLYCVADGSLRRDGKSIPLTAREQVLLDLLVAHRDRWLSRERLLAALFAGFDQGTEAALKNLVLRLRHKIGADAIVNRYGVGYRLRQDDV